MPPIVPRPGRPVHRFALRAAALGRRAAAVVVLLVVLTSGVAAAGAQSPAPPPRPTRAEYLAAMSRGLDRVAGALRGQARERVLFAANLVFAGGALVAGVPIDDLVAYADALREGGARRIDLHPFIAPWLIGPSDPVAKYDALVAHVVDVGGQQLALVPEYDPVSDAGRRFDAWTTAALLAYGEMARRYHPQLMVVVHEPTTTAGRMGESVSPERWADFARAAIDVVKKASPATRCAVAVLPSEGEYLDRFLALPGLDAVALDLYELKALVGAEATIGAARARGKAVYVGETWRTPFVEPDAPMPPTLLDYAAASIGGAAFAALDAQWLGTLVGFASARGLEAISPFWTTTFFHYDADDTSALSAGYRRRVREALARGARTPTFDTYRRLARRYGG